MAITITVPADTKTPGTAGHTADHNTIVDAVTAVAAAAVNSGGDTLTGTLTGADGSVWSSSGLTIAKMPTLTWTPSWTATSVNPALGNGTAAGSYIQIGKFVFFNIEIQTGSTTTFGTGNYLFSVPVTAADTGSGQVCADVRNTGTAHVPCIGEFNDTTHLALVRCSTEALISSTAPGSYSAGTAFFHVTGFYIAA